MAENLQQFIDTLKAQLAKAHTQVTRLEDEHERDTQALQSVWDDFHLVEQKRDEARAANAAKDVALREAARLYHEAKHFILGEVDQERFPSFVECPYWPCVDFRDALSDTGGGWLPPEVRGQAKRALRFYTSASIHRAFHLGYRDDRQENCPHCVEGRVALGTLEATEGEV